MCNAQYLSKAHTEQYISSLFVARPCQCHDHKTNTGCVQMCIMLFLDAIYWKQKEWKMFRLNCTGFISAQCVCVSVRVLGRFETLSTSSCMATVLANICTRLPRT